MTVTQDGKRRLPAERQGTTYRFVIITKDGDGTRELKGYVSTGCHPDGKLAEVFIKVGKSGAESAIYDQWAICASLALQHGVPVEKLFTKFVGARYEPAGLTRSKEFPTCTSVLDLVSRWILARYGKH